MDRPKIQALVILVHIIKYHRMRTHLSHKSSEALNWETWLWCMLYTRPVPVRGQRTIQSLIPFPSPPVNHSSPVLPHAAQSPPTTCDSYFFKVLSHIWFNNLAASIVTASLKQVRSLACSSELSPSSGWDLSRSGRSRAASPRSWKNWFSNIPDNQLAILDTN